MRTITNVALTTLFICASAGCGRGDPQSAVVMTSEALITPGQITILAPAPNQNIVIGTSFVVNGFASGVAANPVDEVTVQIDNQPPVAATLTNVAGGVSYSLTATLPGPPGSHVITAVAILDTTRVRAVVTVVATCASGTLSCSNTCVAPNNARACGFRPLTSWVQPDDGPHFVYTDGIGAIDQFWNIAASSPSTQSLMTVSTSVPAAPNSAMTSWLQSDGPHFAYADASGNIRQFWYTIATRSWATQSLMTVPGAVAAGPNSSMTGWVQSGNPTFVYADANGGLHQFWYTAATGWGTGSLMNNVGFVPAAPNSAMTSWGQADDGPHFVYADANGGLHQIWKIKTDNTALTQNFMTFTGAVPAGPSSAMTSWIQSGYPTFVYADASGGLHQFTYDTYLGWRTASLMNNAGAVTAAPNSGMTSWVQSDDGPHFAYADASGGIHQFWNITLNSASTRSLMTVSGTVLAGPQTPMTGWVQSDGPHFVYTDANGDLQELSYTVSIGVWTPRNLTVAVGP
jgi:hypothetical protein